MKARYLLPFLLLTLHAQPLAAQESISVLFWNVESDGNDPDTIAAQLTELAEEQGPFDVVGLTEVRENNGSLYAEALGDNFTAIVSDSGGSDRMVIAYDDDRFDLMQSMELEEHDGNALNFRSGSGQLRFRSPLVAELREDAGSQSFLFMVNHLARNNGGDNNGGFRVQQAQGLVAWAADQALPIIMGGDLNLDYNFVDQEGNDAFPALFGSDDSDDQEYRWIRPEPLVDTNHSGRGNTDSFPDSILDFVTTANIPATWQVTKSEVIVRPGDFPDNGDTSDHRPVQAVFQTDSENAIQRHLDEIRRQLEAIEAILEEQGL